MMTNSQRQHMIQLLPESKGKPKALVARSVFSCAGPSDQKRDFTLIEIIAYRVFYPWISVIYTGNKFLYCLFF
ncbi:hypothetical protein [Candidatus Hamiltonella defensa]|uniref:hypothetical protein n=1 Tax=Candidatus Williamhamiltonella defendens TaxID=138072 RepID=UPI0011D03D28|nr:hypothetical protein [Candidatus Hamiltonella defensa]